jgi:MYXO-CTERM domain-containing protein
MLVAAAACSAAPAPAPSADAGPLARALAQSAESNHVPRDLMVAVAAVEGGLAMPAHRDVDPASAVPVAGPLELRHGAFDSLARGAALAGTTELALRADADLALEASARVLAELGAARGAREDDLASWEPSVEAMSGYADDAHRADYARRVYAVLSAGGAFAARDGETVTLVPHDEVLALLAPLTVTTAPADYGPAEWFDTPATNKWTAGRPNGAVDRIVIHDTEGGWDASVATLQNDPGKSVHYIVGQDGRVGQFVHETDTAWHAGNWFYNTKSVGIEHVGYFNQPYPAVQYAASAALVKYLAAKYAVPKDRTHIVGHDQIPNGNVMPENSAPCEEAPATCETGSSYGGADNHRDPGDWEWCIYMVEDVGGTCKCNDIWSLWNCSSDHTEAFRCDNGKVEIEHCDGPGACVSMPNGTNDVCNMAPPPSPPSDAGGSPPQAPAADAAAPLADGAGTPLPGADATASTSMSGGCSASPAGRASPLAALALAVLAFAGSRRRRRRTAAS